MPRAVTGGGSGPGKEVIGSSWGNRVRKGFTGGRPCVWSLNEAELEHCTQLCRPPMGIFFGPGPGAKKGIQF